MTYSSFSLHFLQVLRTLILEVNCGKSLIFISCFHHVVVDVRGEPLPVSGH